MKEELLKNGYITFDIDTNHTELNRIYTELIDNEKFDALKISYNSVSDNNKTPFVNFIQNESKKNELLNRDNLEQIWHWKQDQQCYDLLYSIFKKFFCILIFYQLVIHYQMEKPVCLYILGIILKKIFQIL